MSSSSTTTEPTVRETPEVSGDDNANARAAVHSANKPGAAYAAAVANGESERAWIRRVVLLLTGQAFSLLGSNIVQLCHLVVDRIATKTGSAMLLATLFGVVPQAIVSICGGLLGRPSQSQVADYAAGYGDCCGHRRAVAELRDGMGESDHDFRGAVHSFGGRRGADARCAVVHTGCCSLGQTIARQLNIRRD